MRILLSAFACRPRVGSEGGVGWRWANELAKEHEVVVLTDPTRREAIEAELAEQPVPHLHFEFYRPRWLRFLPLNSMTAHFIYLTWQFGLSGRARQLHAGERFDITWHLTYGVYRHPCFLGGIGVPMVFGPVGGGEDAPWRLKRSMTGLAYIKEVLRWLANRLAVLDPFLWTALSKSTWIITKTRETRDALPWPFRQRALVYPEIGIDSCGEAPASRAPGAPLRVLFAGRLLAWKGAHLALRAVAQAARQGVTLEFTIVGTGSYARQLRRLCTELGVESNVSWIQALPQQELFARMAQSHVFLFPSLHDSSGNVVLEAQSRGLPVICLDRGGPCTLVATDSAVVVRTAGCSEEQVVDALAAELAAMADDEARRMAMGRAAIALARRSSWNARVSGLLSVIART